MTEVTQSDQGDPNKAGNRGRLCGSSDPSNTGGASDPSETSEPSDSSRPSEASDSCDPDEPSEAREGVSLVTQGPSDLCDPSKWLGCLK